MTLREFALVLGPCSKPSKQFADKFFFAPKTGQDGYANIGRKARCRLLKAKPIRLMILPCKIYPLH